MPISLIASTYKYKNKLAIGCDNGLLFKSKYDITFFKNITTNMKKNYTGTFDNVVVMGYKTYLTIPERFRPLPNRINFVLTRNKKIYNCSRNTVQFNSGNVYYMSMAMFIHYQLTLQFNTFIMGGGEIYNYFLDKTNNMLPDYLYITEFTGKVTNTPTVFMNNYTEEWKLDGYSEKKEDCRMLYYSKSKVKSQEHMYLDLMKDILINGNVRKDRTGTGTVSVFGRQMRFDISKSIPLLTTKNVPYKMVLEELLWFCRGDTDAKILQEKGIHIWDGNTSREFLDNRGLQHYPTGVLGAGYGWQIRFQGAKYHSKYADTSKLTKEERDNIGGFDQLRYVEELLQNDPTSRRIMMSYWTPNDFKYTALPPCHFSILFYVENNTLSAQFIMRSNDVFLGNPFNIASYAMLVYILAKRNGYEPGELIFTGNDVHLYKNHLDAVKTQLSRTPRPLPKLFVKDSVKNKDWCAITNDDFELIGYMPYPGIKAVMSI